MIYIAYTNYTTGMPVTVKKLQDGVWSTEYTILLSRQYHAGDIGFAEEQQPLPAFAGKMIPIKRNKFFQHVQEARAAKRTF